MKHTSTFLLATAVALALAACGPRRSDNTSGSETGATGGAYDTTSTSTTPATSDTGLKSSTDTARMSTDTAKTSPDSAKH